VLLFALIGTVVTVVAALASVLLSSGLESADTVASVVGAVIAMLGLGVSVYGLLEQRRKARDDDHRDP
jgi:hypothetical protein